MPQSLNDYPYQVLIDGNHVLEQHHIPIPLQQINALGIQFSFYYAFVISAVVALLRGNELFVANAGDSRCVVCR